MERNENYLSLRIYFHGIISRKIIKVEKILKINTVGNTDYVYNDALFISFILFQVHLR